MKLPASARIAGYKCKITRADLIVNGEGDYGTFDYNTNEIEIARETDFASEEQEASTLLHEIIHGVLGIYKIKVPDEEEMVEKLETALIQVLRDNKTLFRAILKALK
jgi:hypothetical protein